jgi:molecular chaperone DnaK (HSP70)
MQAIFEPVILRAIGYVQGQIQASKKKIRAVLLVGGFGQNNYLKERLRDWLGGIEVLQPPNAWTAIVRGAVMMGLSRASSALTTVAVASRRARKHYGVQLRVVYDSERHDASEKQDHPIYR